MSRKPRLNINRFRAWVIGLVSFSILPLAIFWKSLKNGDQEEYLLISDNIPTEAVIRSVQVIEYEVREGMRKVRVGLQVPGATSQEITVTEWIPVVLLGRLRTGARVSLIKDPARDTVTIGL